MSLPTSSPSIEHSHTPTAGPKHVIVLDGDGMASVCTARLLADAGLPWVRQGSVRPKLAAILMGEQTQHLLREIFPKKNDSEPDLFEGFATISRRIVLWGDSAAPLNL